jgi:hypothetical protein
VHPTRRSRAVWGSHSIPFGTTDYDEQSSQYVAQLIVACADVVIAAFPITPNPFHMPGQHQVGSLKLPTLSNGFVTAVFGAEEGNPKE